MFCACLLPWLQSPSIWHHGSVLFNAEKMLGWRMEALYCVFLNKDIFPSFGILLRFYRKPKPSIHMQLSAWINTTIGCFGKQEQDEWLGLKRI